MADIVLEETFNNIKVVNEVMCPTIIMHGMEDKLVPYQDSIDLTMNGFKNSQTHLFLRDTMSHNRFEYGFDIIKPLEYFFSYHKIIESHLIKNPRKSSKGYVDPKIKYFSKTPGFKSNS